MYESKPKNKMFLPHISTQAQDVNGKRIMANWQFSRSQGFTKVTVEDISLTDATNISIYLYDWTNIVYLYKDGAWVEHTEDLIFRDSDGVGQLTIESTGSGSGWSVARMLNVTFE